MSKKHKNKNNNQNAKKDLAELMDAFDQKDEAETVENKSADVTVTETDKKDAAVSGTPAHAAAPKKNKDKSDKKKKAKKSDKTDAAEKGEKTVSPAKLVITLTAICAAVALLLAAVNFFTETRIAENNEKAILESIRDIFDESVQAQAIEVPEGTGFSSLYLVTKNGGACGYSAVVAPSGFGGPINLMVGIDSDGAVVGVDVISMSETPGLGSKTGSADFLSQFMGMSGNVKVDAISGATISSTAVGEGVNSVTANLLDLKAIAETRGLAVVPYVRDAVAETTTTDETTTIAPVTTAPDETEPGIGAPDVTKNDSPPDVIVPNPGDGKTGIHAEYVEDTTEFETLTTEPESSESETTAE